MEKHSAPWQPQGAFAVQGLSLHSRFGREKKAPIPIRSLSLRLKLSISELCRRIDLHFLANTLQETKQIFENTAFSSGLFDSSCG